MVGAKEARAFLVADGWERAGSVGTYDIFRKAGESFEYRIGERGGIRRAHLALPHLSTCAKRALLRKMSNGHQEPDVATSG